MDKVIDLIDYNKPTFHLFACELLILRKHTKANLKSCYLGLAYAKLFCRRQTSRLSRSVQWKAWCSNTSWSKWGKQKIVNLANKN